MGGALTTTYDRIIRQPALTMPGNFTGSEAACTAGNASSIRTLLSLGTADSPSFSGLTLAGNLLFNPTNTYDVGNGTYDPRTVRAATSVLSPLFNNPNAAATTLGNSTYGVTVPGAATFSGDISMSKTSAQGYVYAYDTTGARYVRMYANGSQEGLIETNAGALVLFPYAGAAQVVRPGSNATLSIYDSSAIKYTRITHDGTNGIVSTSSGALVLSSSAGFVRAYTSGVQTYLQAWDSAFSAAIYMTHSGSVGEFGTTTGNITMYPATGRVDIARSGVAGVLRVYDTTAIKYAQLTHDSTNVVLSTSAGNLNLVPTGGTVAVTGAVTASGNATLTGSTATVAASTSLLRLTSAATGFEFRPFNGYIEQWTSGSDGQFNIYNSAGTKRLKLFYNGTLDAGMITTNTKLMLDIASTAGVLGFGQVGNAGDPGLKRGGLNTLSARSADDTADSAFTCAGITASGVLATTSGRTKQIATKSANYTLATADHVVIATANTFDFTLPTAVGSTAEYEMINAGTGVITIKTTSAQTISGSASGALTLAQWKSMTVQSDGSNWLIISQIT